MNKTAIVWQMDSAVVFGSKQAWSRFECFVKFLLKLSLRLFTKIFIKEVFGLDLGFQFRATHYITRRSQTCCPMQSKNPCTLSE